MNNISQPAFYREVFKLRPWYHDFGVFGIDTSFKNLPFLYKLLHIVSRKRLILGENYCKNISSKDRVILPMMDEGIELLFRIQKDKYSFLDLFCSDGYYSFHLIRKANRHNIMIKEVTCIDIDAHSLKQGKCISKILGLQNIITFKRQDVMNIDGLYDMCLCFGGLYHISDPYKLLQNYMII